MKNKNTYYLWLILVLFLFRTNSILVRSPNNKICSENIKRIICGWFLCSCFVPITNSILVPSPNNKICSENITTLLCEAWYSSSAHINSSYSSSCWRFELRQNFSVTHFSAFFKKVKICFLLTAYFYHARGRYVENRLSLFFFWK